MFKLRTGILTLLVLIASLSVMAQTPSFSVHAPRQVIQGRTFTVTFRVTNAQVGAPQAPELAGCEFRYGPATSTMSSMTFSNGHQESTTAVDYSYTYYAAKAGTANIPAMSITANGKRLTSKATSIQILPPDKSQQQQQNPYGGAEQSQQSQQMRPSAKISPNDLIVTVSMSKNHIYEGEAVIATIKVYTKHDITSFRATTLPSFDGFLSEELEVKEQPKLEHYRGENYFSAVLKRCLLYPQKSGTLTINSGRYDVTLQTYEAVTQGFFVTRVPVEQNITTTSNSVSVKVDALPTPQPAGFNGAVGRFQASTSLEPSLLRTNEAATYTLNITGTGNIKYLSAPEIDFGPNVEEYQPETESEAQFTGSDMQGKFTATYTFVPQQIGSIDIDAQQFVYFDPSTARYVTIDLPAYDRKVVKGSDAPAGTVVEQKNIDKKMDDILHIKPLGNEKLRTEHSRFFNSVFYVLCYVIVILALVMAAVVYRRRVKLNSDVMGLRNARANKVAARRLKEARRMMNARDNDAFYASLASALWGYVGDKLAIPSSALTRDNISEKLEEAGASSDLIGRTINVLDECEMARFTPQHSDSEVSSLYQNAVDVINGLEATKPKKQ